jgi:hypothetical protein
MKNPDIRVCDLIESKMNKIIDTLNKMGSAIEANPLNRISGWIIYQLALSESRFVFQRFNLGKADSYI